MTRIWLVNWHFQSRITLWCRHKSTNISMGLCWEMPKFIVWRLWSIYFDQHLPLKPSIRKRRKRSCTPNMYSWWNSYKHVLNISRMHIYRFIELHLEFPHFYRDEVLGKNAFIVKVCFRDHCLCTISSIPTIMSRILTWLRMVFRPNQSR